MCSHHDLLLTLAASGTIFILECIVLFNSNSWHNSTTEEKEEISFELLKNFLMLVPLVLVWRYILLCPPLDLENYWLSIYWSISLAWVIIDIPSRLISLENPGHNSVAFWTDIFVATGTIFILVVLSIWIWMRWHSRILQILSYLSG